MIMPCIGKQYYNLKSMLQIFSKLVRVNKRSDKVIIRWIRGYRSAVPEVLCLSL